MRRTGSQFGVDIFMLTLLVGLMPVIAVASSHLPLGDGIDHTYRSIPFEIYGVVMETRYTPGDTTVTEPIILSSWQDLSSYGSAKRLHVIQHCAWADNVPTGVVVGHMTVLYEDGSTSTCDLIVGKNTAEWSYDNPALQPYLQHHKVLPAYSSPVDDNGDGVPEYYGHLFYESMKLDNKPLVGLELTLDEASYTNEEWSYGYAPWDWFGISILAITVEYPGAPAKDPKEALVGHWKLDEKKGATASDSSGYDRDGVLWGDPLWLPKGGVLHGALWLDAEDDYVSLPIGSLISGLTDCTIMTWVNWSGMYSWQRIFDFGSGTEVNMFLTPTSGEGSGSTNPYELRFAITVGGGGAEERIGTFALLAGWHHVAVTVDADDGVGTLYLGGMPVAVNDAMTLTPSDLGATSQNWLGRSQYPWDSYFEGCLDDFRIYDQVLSEGEIQAVMSGD